LRFEAPGAVAPAAVVVRGLVVQASDALVMRPGSMAVE
jgi:hypothetical protein